MAKVRTWWRLTALVSAATLALALTASAFGQAPPQPPHMFFGSADTGTAAQLDGAQAADGGIVSATNENGEVVGTGAIDAGTWLIQVDPADATSVTFSIDGSAASAAFDVTSGDLTEVALDLTAAAAEEPAAEEPAAEEPAAEEPAAEEPAAGEAPTGLPNTGSGGLAGAGSSLPALPLVLVAAVVLALGGVAVTRRTFKA